MSDRNTWYISTFSLLGKRDTTKILYSCWGTQSQFYFPANDPLNQHGPAWVSFYKTGHSSFKHLGNLMRVLGSIERLCNSLQQGLMTSSKPTGHMAPRWPIRVPRQWRSMAMRNMWRLCNFMHEITNNVWTKWNGEHHLTKTICICMYIYIYIWSMIYFFKLSNFEVFFAFTNNLKFKSRQAVNLCEIALEIHEQNEKLSMRIQSHKHLTKNLHVSFFFFHFTSQFVKCHCVHTNEHTDKQFVLVWIPILIKSSK